MIDSENGKQIAADDEARGTECVEPAERTPLEPLASPPNVIGMDAYRVRSRGSKGKAHPHGADDADSGVWERTSQPLLPEDAERSRPVVHIVKVSSGFGRLRVPAPSWNDDIRCQAAA